MLSDCGGRGLRPDPPSPAGVNLLPATTQNWSVKANREHKYTPMKAEGLVVIRFDKYVHQEPTNKNLLVELFTFLHQFVI